MFVSRNERIEPDAPLSFSLFLFFDLRLVAIEDLSDAWFPWQRYQL
jgi:hypothetical protein